MRRLSSILAVLLLAASCHGPGPTGQDQRAVGKIDRLPHRLDWTDRLKELIFGGVEVQSNLFDFTAGLYNGTTFKCAGTVLAGGWVVTAAHCGSIDSVVPGIDQSGGSQSGLAVDECLRHGSYDQATAVNDLALIKLKAPPSGPWLVPAEDDRWEQQVKPVVNILGWGAGCGQASHKLCQAQVDRVDPAVCAQSYLFHHRNYPIDQFTLCTTSSLLVGTGDGDSGGPVVADTAQGTRLVGVISVGNGTDVPNRHMKVSSYIDWMKKVMAGDLTETKPCGS